MPKDEEKGEQNGEEKQDENGEKKAKEKTCCQKTSEGMVKCYMGTVKCITVSFNAFLHTMSYCCTPMKEWCVNSCVKGDKARHPWKEPNYTCV